MISFKRRFRAIIEVEFKGDTNGMPTNTDVPFKIVYSLKPSVKVNIPKVKKSDASKKEKK